MMRYCLAATVLVMGVCWAMANTAFALGDTCSNVDITLTNSTVAKIKVTSLSTTTTLIKNGARKSCLVWMDMRS